MNNKRENHIFHFVFRNGFQVSKVLTGETYKDLITLLNKSRIGDKDSINFISEGESIGIVWGDVVYYSFSKIDGENIEKVTGKDM